MLYRGTTASMLARDAWVATGSFLEFGAPLSPYRIFIREAGQPNAPAILFLHGFPTSSWDFAKVEPLLTERYRLGFLDFLGFGASAKPARHAYSLMEQAQVARAALGSLGFDRFHLVAHDYGVAVAQQLLCEPALRGRIAGLTLLNDVLYAAMHRATPVETVLRSTGGPLFRRSVSRDRFLSAFRSQFATRHQPGSPELDQHWVAFSRDGGVALAPRLLRYLDERAEFASMCESALEQSEAPLNFVWGMLDPAAGRATLEYTVPRLARFPEITTLPDAGHYPHIEAPERVAASIGAFVDANAGGARSAVLTSG